MGRKHKTINLRIGGETKPTRFQTIEDITCPDWLSPIAKEHWKELAPQLKNLGLLSVVDRESLAMACECYADYRQAVQAIKEDGHFFKTHVGTKKPHPALSESRKFLESYHKLVRDFGIAPSNRKRVDVDQEEKIDDPLQSFLDQSD